MAKLFWDLQQGSVDWQRLRSVVPTASRFDDIISPMKQELSAARKKYACQIIAGRLLNWQPDSLEKIEHIAEGKRNEPIAVGMMEAIREIETKPIGFVTTDNGRFGASPDRVMTRDETIHVSVECKCPTIPVQFEYLLRAELAQMKPASPRAEAYRCQRQGQLFVTEAEEAIFFSFQERMPPVYEREYRDEPFIKKLAAALDQFHEELEMLEDRARSLGVYQAFETFSAPLDAEYGPMNALVQILETGNWGG